MQFSLSDINWPLSTWKRLVFSSIFIALCYFWHSGMMLHHVWNSPFQYKGSDFTYWLFYYLGIGKGLTANHTLAFCFSILLLASFLSAAIFIKQRWLAITSGILLLLYQVVFNMKIGYHTHHLFGFQFALLPFYFKENLFKSSLGLARILCCLAYFFAGFFKLYQGAWLSYDSFSYVLSNQHGAYLYFHPETLRSAVVTFMIGHHWMGYLFFLFAMVLQLSFIAGVFSNKWNKWLALFILMFHVMDWFLMNLGVFMGMCVMVWLLLYKDSEERI